MWLDYKPIETSNLYISALLWRPKDQANHIQQIFMNKRRNVQKETKSANNTKSGSKQQRTFKARGLHTLQNLVFLTSHLFTKSTNSFHLISWMQKLDLDLCTHHFFSLWHECSRLSRRKWLSLALLGSILPRRWTYRLSDDEGDAGQVVEFRALLLTLAHPMILDSSSHV